MTALNEENLKGKKDDRGTKIQDLPMSLSLSLFGRGSRARSQIFVNGTMTVG